MPIYEYSCPECGVQFEKLVDSRTTVACPACASGRVIWRISVVGIKTGSQPAGMAGAPRGGCCGGGCGCR